MATRVAGVAARTSERRFYGGMAAAILLTNIVGFAPSYYLRGLVEPYAPVLPTTPLVHLHGALFSGWILLFVAQVGLVGARRADLHRKLGLAAFALLPAMIVVGLITALHAALRFPGLPNISPLQFLAVPLFDIPVFTLLIGAALWKRLDAQLHKRLMLIAMIGMLSPALGRLPWPPTLPLPLMAFGMPDLFLLPLIGWDLASRGRLHAATLWGSALLVGSQILRVWLMGTPGWVAFADWAVGFVR